MVVGAIALAGCLGEASDTETDFLEEAAPTAPVAPTHIDEESSLLTAPMDETWTWTMSPGMTGRVLIELTGTPTSTGGHGIVCYRLDWPQGHHSGGSNCQDGDVGIYLSPGSTASTTTVYDVRLLPNSFTLHVWTDRPDTASVRVFVDTHLT